MAPTLKCTEESVQHRNPRSLEMNTSRINREPCHNAVTVPSNFQTQRGDGSATPTSHEDGAELLTATAQQNENQAYVPSVVSCFVSSMSRVLSPVWRVIRAIQTPQITDNQPQQYEGLLDQIKMMQDQLFEMKTMEEQVNATVAEVQEAVGQGLRGIKKELRRNLVKEEKAAGKPKQKLNMYNVHVKEECKRLKALGSDKKWFQEAAVTWKMMSVEEKSRRYGGLLAQNNERSEREMESWRESRGYTVEDRKPAAKPTPEELAATQEPPQSHPEESSAPTGSTDLGEGYTLSPYEQQRLDRIERNEERLKNLKLLSTTGVEAQESGGFLSRNGGKSSVTSKKRRGKKRKNTDPPSRRSPRKNRLDNDSSAEVPCPVGYKFVRSVPSSSLHAGYDRMTEVVGVDGEWRHCKYTDYNGKERLSKLLLRTIQEA